MAVRKMSQPARSEDGSNNDGESASAARLAPPEEKDASLARQHPQATDGTLAINTGQLKFPQELTEEEEENRRFMPMDPVVLAIFCFTLLFILSIAYVVWSGWEPPR